ncbi:hypothetical protein ACTHGU_04775 [Chitinophagaceae bacterium MMS25-I14]
MKSFVKDIMKDIYEDIARKMFADADEKMKAGETTQINIDEPAAMPYLAAIFKRNGYTVEEERNKLFVTKN